MSSRPPRLAASSRPRFIASSAVCWLTSSCSSRAIRERSSSCATRRRQPSARSRSLVARSSAWLCSTWSSARRRRMICASRPATSPDCTVRIVAATAIYTYTGSWCQAAGSRTSPPPAPRASIASTTVTSQPGTPRNIPMVCLLLQPATALDAQLRQRPRKRRVDRREFLVRDLVAEPGGGALARFLRPRLVDVLGRDRHVGDDRHAVAGDLDQPLADGHEGLARALAHDHLARNDLG